MHPGQKLKPGAMVFVGPERGRSIGRAFKKVRVAQRRDDYAALVTRLIADGTRNIATRPALARAAVTLAKSP